MISQSFNLVTRTPSGATEQYCHANASSVIRFFTSETSYNVAHFVVPTHVDRQRYFVTPASLARLKELDLKIFSRAVIIKILNKK
jgi:hypothetical protein